MGLYFFLVFFCLLCYHLIFFSSFYQFFLVGFVIFSRFFLFFVLISVSSSASSFLLFGFILHFHVFVFLSFRPDSVNLCTGSNISRLCCVSLHLSLWLSFILLSFLPRSLTLIISVLGYHYFFLVSRVPEVFIFSRRCFISVILSCVILVIMLPLNFYSLFFSLLPPSYSELAVRLHPLPF